MNKEIQDIKNQRFLGSPRDSKDSLKDIKKELKEQNEFLKSLLRSFEDIKKDRISDFKFSS
jgi:hypothetical protein